MLKLVVFETSSPYGYSKVKYKFAFFVAENGPHSLQINNNIKPVNLTLVPLTIIFREWYTQIKLK